MRKIIAIGFIIAGVIVSCHKEDIKPNLNNSASTCNCYEKHEAVDTYTGSDGFPKVAWMFKYNTTPQPDLCEKATGVWVYSGKPTSHRYLVICN
jgi:hypothetical protein